MNEADQRDELMDGEVVDGDATEATEEMDDEGDEENDLPDAHPAIVALQDVFNYLAGQTPEDPEDTSPINFDTSLPSAHKYLGDVDIVPHKEVCELTHGAAITVPLFSFPHVVLFPGESLPLVLTELPQGSALASLEQSSTRLIGVANSHFKSEVITLAEIRYRRKSNAGTDDSALIAVGLHRMLLRSVRQVDGNLIADGIIFEDAPTRIPMEARRNMTFWPTATWKLYDSRILMKQARKLAGLLEAGVGEVTSHMHPTQYSFWLARSLPLQDSLRHALLEKPSTQERLAMEISLLKRFSEIKCNRCDRTLSTAENMLNMSTEGTLGSYANAYGYIHETVTVKRMERTSVILDNSPPSTEQSWFPGYAWTIMYCAGCFGHIGWKYNAVDSNTHPHIFWGLRRAALASPPLAAAYADH